MRYILLVLVLVLLLDSLAGAQAQDVSIPDSGLNAAIRVTLTVLQSGDLAAWGVLGTATNSVGSISFVDATAPLSSRKFYRARANP